MDDPGPHDERGDEVAPPPRDRRPHAGTAPTTPVETAFDWCFRDRSTGQIVVAQFPNIALGIFLATIVVRWFVAEDSAAFTAGSWIAAAALGWWSLDELIRGVNPWRRALGIGGLVATTLAVAALLGGP